MRDGECGGENNCQQLVDDVGNGRFANKSGRDWQAGCGSVQKPATAARPRRSMGPNLIPNWK